MELFYNHLRCLCTFYSLCIQKIICLLEIKGETQCCRQVRFKCEGVRGSSESIHVHLHWSRKGTTKIYFYLIRFLGCFCLACLQVDLPDVQQPPPPCLKWAKQPVSPPPTILPEIFAQLWNRRLVKSSQRANGGPKQRAVPRFTESHKKVTAVCHVAAYSV